MHESIHVVWIPLLVIGLILIIPHPVQAQILTANTTVKINVTNGFHAIMLGNLIVNLIARPINSSYVNVTVISRYLINGSAAPMDFQVIETNYNSTTGVIDKLTVTWINTTTPTASQVILWSPMANSITWDAYYPSQKQWIPGYNQYLVTPVTMPIITPPTPILEAAPLIFLAIMIGVAGRHKPRDAGLGLLAVAVFGGWVLSLLGLTLIQIGQITIIFFFIAIVLLGLGSRR
ncbi:MAG: hypothetical protein RXR03_07625 [Thermocladium sp.]